MMEQQFDFIPKPERTFRFGAVSFCVWMTLLLIALLFRMQNWPGRGLLLLVSTGGMAAFNFASLIVLRGRHILNNIFSFLSILWIAWLSVDIIGRYYHLVSETGLYVFLGILAVCWVIYLLAYRKFIVRSA